MYNLFLIWDLDISPEDKNIGEIKINLNLDSLKRFSLKNEEMYERLRTKKYCPTLNSDQKKFIDIFYFNGQINGYNIEMRFFEIKNTMLLTSEIEDSILRDAMKRHFQNMHDVITKSDEVYHHRRKLMIDKIEERDFYNLSPLDISLKTRLFNYQINNINWMINNEENQRLVQFTEDKLIHLPDGRVYNQTRSLFIKKDDIPFVLLRGGIIADEVGKGKTIQMLSLCCKRNIPTLILVPKHLVSHWNSELKKHFLIEMNLTIVSFDSFNQVMLKNIERLIIDEIHLLFLEERNYELYNIVSSVDVKYKWGLTASPFEMDGNIYKIFQYLTNLKINYYNCERYLYYTELYQSLFKRNVNRNISDELVLPPIIFHNHLLDFNETERTMYEAEISAKQNASEMDLRKFCCDSMLDYQKDDSMTEEQLKMIVVKDFERKWRDEISKLNVLKENLEKIRAHIEQKRKEGQLTQELLSNEKLYISLIEEQMKAVKNREISYNLINNCLIDSKKECCICRDDIGERDYCILKICQHFFCKECVDLYLKRSSSCPMCRSVGANEYYVVGKVKERTPYSTKFMKILNILKQTEEQFIIFTQFDRIIDRMIEILSKEGIYSLRFSEENIEHFRNLESRVLILSSKNNACGLDLSFVNNIIIFEPIKNEYVRDTEKQIIGRISRINQTKDCHVHRLIIKNTIEEEIYSNII